MSAGRSVGANQDEKVRWLVSPESTNEPCFLCANRLGNQIVLQADHWHAAGGSLDFAICGACRSGYFLDAARKNVAYPDDPHRIDDPNFRLLLYHYIELLDGLDWKVPILERLAPRPAHAVLEIGCSVGTTLDYCQTSWGCDAVGLEPSAYGQGGAQLLGLPILQELLDECSAIKDRRFDVALSIEVLEHVPEPRAFLRSIRGQLSPGGLLFFTTPDIAIVSRETEASYVSAALSAGAHYFVGSTGALKSVIRDSGFEHVTRLHSRFSHLFVASDRPFELRAPCDPTPNLFRYYSKRLEKGGADPRVELLFAMRAYESGARVGAHSEIAELPDLIDRRLESVFGLSLSEPLEVANRIANTTDVFTFLKTVSCALPDYLQARASQLPSSALARAIEWRALGALISLHGLRVDSRNLSLYEHYFQNARRVTGVREIWCTTDTGRKLLEELIALEARVLPAPAVTPLGAMKTTLRALARLAFGPSSKTPKASG